MSQSGFEDCLSTVTFEMFLARLYLGKPLSTYMLPEEKRMAVYEERALPGLELMRRRGDQIQLCMIDYLAHSR